MSAPLSCKYQSGKSAGEMKNIGKITKFMVPAKFSSCLTCTDKSNPRAPNIIPVRTSAGKTYNQEKGSENPTLRPVHQSNGRQITKNAYACRTDKNVPDNNFAVSKYQRGRGAVKSSLIIPISRSYTIDREDCMPLKSSTMQVRPGNI